MKRLPLFLLILLATGCNPVAMKDTELQNPIIPGYFADPSIVQHDGKFYMYVTADPWGTDFLTCWVSDNFRDWTFQTLNWPTKQACTSPTSKPNKVWAPSVIRKDDTFYMYVSIGSEVWCGKANHPLGPWENMLGDQPMIAYDTTHFYHVIDAETFIDDNGRAYLYWGSGHGWKNGHCYAAELNDDMSSFKAEPIEVTPTRYFEAPLMLKHNGKYYLTYSEGKTIDETYEVRYAVGDTPFGPFAEAANSPVLTLNDSLEVYGPGHHTVFQYGGKNYMLYHKHRLSFVKGSAYRQTCISEFTFDDARGQINTIIPYPTQSFPLIGEERKQIQPAKVEASSVFADPFRAGNVLDHHYGTRWEAADEDKNPVITTTFKGETGIGSMEIRFEYPWKKYFIKIERSANGKDWEVLANYTKDGVSGSPVIIPVKAKCSHIRTSFAEANGAAKPSVWELCFYND